MARKVFFSFHYERDAWRAAQVRNCDMLKPEDQYGIIDAVEWESIERNGRSAIERWISEQLKYTSTTVVLIGAETAFREWVRYEILQSWNRGNTVLGLLIHSVKNQKREIDSPGPNPFDYFQLPNGRRLSEICKTYDWNADDGRNNLSNWIETNFEIRAQHGSDQKVVEAPLRQQAQSAAIFTPRAPWLSSDDHSRR